MSRVFAQRVSEYAAFRATYGHDPSQGATKPRERSLSKWLSNQRAAGKRGELSAERTGALDEVNPDWVTPEGKYSRVFHQRLSEYAAFRATYGHDPSKNETEPRERSLGNWLTDQRGAAKRGELSAERTGALDKVNPGWVAHEGKYSRAFTQRLSEYADFRAAHQRNPSMKATDPGERSLGNWLSYIRRRAEKGELMGSRHQALEEVNPRWRGSDRGPRQRPFSERLSEYAAFRATHGHDPSQGATEPRERSLGKWLSNQRQAAKRGRLSAERTGALDEVNPDWVTPEGQYNRVFHQRLSEYADFRTAHGRDPARRGTEPGEHSLGIWLSHQRAAGKRGRLSAERTRALDEVNPDWRGAGR